MSRSWKRYPHWTNNCNGRVKKAKKEANKKVRRILDLDNGSAYKRLYETWDIHDDTFVDYLPRQMLVPEIWHWGDKVLIWNKYETDRDWYKAISK